MKWAKIFIFLFLICFQYSKSNKFTVPIEKHHKGLVGIVDGIRVYDQRRLERSLDFTKSNITQPLKIFQNIEYIANVTFVTLPQQYRVILDTSSSDTWIPGADCKGRYGPCRSNGFNKTSSTTFQDQHKRFSILYYGFRQERIVVVGHVGRDTVGLGDINENKLVVQNQGIGVVKYLGSAFYSDAKYDGIVGLGFSSGSSENENSVFENAVKQGLVDQPVFTIWTTETLDSVEGKFGGQITYGGYDNDHCDNSYIYWTNTSSSLKYWQFELDDFIINDQRMGNKYRAITDSRTDYIVVKEDLFAQIIKIFGADYSLPMLPCNSDISLTIVLNDDELVIEARHLLIKDYASDQMCGLAVVSAAFGHDDIDIVLGDAFIRQFCQIHDVAKKRLGLAQNKIYL